MFYINSLISIDLILYTEIDFNPACFFFLVLSESKNQIMIQNSHRPNCLSCGCIILYFFFFPDPLRFSLNPPSPSQTIHQVCYEVKWSLTVFIFKKDQEQQKEQTPASPVSGMSTSLLLQSALLFKSLMLFMSNTSGSQLWMRFLFSPLVSRTEKQNYN